MKYNITINQKQAVKMGITNINQLIIFDLLANASVWADPIIIEDRVYYFVARQKVMEELPLLGLKSDTIYRHLKGLNDLGLIDYKKEGKKDCVKVTELGKSYFSTSKNSEIDPNKLGNRSEKHSEIDPTYNNTRAYNNYKTNTNTLSVSEPTQQNKEILEKEENTGQ